MASGYNASIELRNANRGSYSPPETRSLLDKRIGINPDKYFLETVIVPSDVKREDLYTALTDAEGNLMVDYRPVNYADKGLGKSGEELPKVIDGTKNLFPEYKTVEEVPPCRLACGSVQQRQTRLH